MSQITRSYSFSDGTTAYGSQVESEVANLVNNWNNHDSGASQWTALKTSGDLTVAGNLLLSGYIPSTNRLLFKGSGGTLISQIGYLLNQMIIQPDSTNGLAINGNMVIGETSGSFGGASKGAINIVNATSEPSVAPASGGILYAYGGTLYWLSSAGNKRTVAAV